MKKIISVLMAVAVLVLFVLPCFVSAEGKPTFEVSSVSVNAGEDVDVKIDIKNNPGITSAKLKVTFDDGIALKKVTYGNFEGLFQQPQELKSPVVLNWINGKADLKDDAEYATLTFTADSNAYGKYNILVSYDSEDVYNLKEQNVKFDIIDGTVTVTDDESAADILTIATGEEKDDGNGDYIGEEEILEFEDGKGSPITEKGQTSKEAKVIFILVAVLALAVIVVVVMVIVKKRITTKQD